MGKIDRLKAQEQNGLAQAGLIHVQNDSGALDDAQIVTIIIGYLGGCEWDFTVLSQAFSSSKVQGQDSTWFELEQHPSK